MPQTNQKEVIITNGPWTMENGTQYALVTLENKHFWIKKPTSETRWFKSLNLETPENAIRNS